MPNSYVNILRTEYTCHWQFRTDFGPGRCEYLLKLPTDNRLDFRRSLKDLLSARWILFLYKVPNVRLPVSVYLDPGLEFGGLWDNTLTTSTLGHLGLGTKKTFRFNSTNRPTIRKLLFFFTIFRGMRRIISFLEK